MTDEVARLVLADNYHQNRALAAARAQSAQMLHVHARYIRKLEREGRIRRRLDVLPADKDIAERRSTSSGLTLPEFSVLLAHTKIATGQEVLASDVPDDPYLQRALTRYFPIPLRERFTNRMPSHRLHREIITTAVVNEMVDKSGITFACSRCSRPASSLSGPPGGCCTSGGRRSTYRRLSTSSPTAS
jgi:glutamate dehydrogenase